MLDSTNPDPQRWCKFIAEKTSSRNCTPTGTNWRKVLITCTQIFCKRLLFLNVNDLGIRITRKSVWFTIVFLNSGCISDNTIFVNFSRRCCVPVALTKSFCQSGILLPLHGWTRGSDRYSREDQSIRLPSEVIYVAVLIKAVLSVLWMFLAKLQNWFCAVECRSVRMH
jgi:hypothetical protein